MRDKILEMLRARPFQAFRIELASGSVHVVRHPDQVMAFESLLFVGVPIGDQPGPEYADVAIVSIAQVTNSSY